MREMNVSDDGARPGSTADNIGSLYYYTLIL